MKSKFAVFAHSVEAFLSVAKDSIPFEKIHKYLPFPTRTLSGDNFNHIVNDSIYAVKTERHVIEDGDTLCQRLNARLHPKSGMLPACPGCLAIARGLAVRDLHEDHQYNPWKQM